MPKLETLETAVITILDDDVVPAAQFETSYLMLSEGAGTATITVTLSDASAKPISVDYAVEGITAQVDSDYEGESGSLTFMPGEISQSFMLKILDDTWREMNESIQLTLTETNNAEFGDPKELQIILVDNDSTNLYLPFVSTRP